MEFFYSFFALEKKNRLFAPAPAHLFLCADYFTLELTPQPPSPG